MTRRRTQKPIWFIERAPAAETPRRAPGKTSDFSLVTFDVGHPQWRYDFGGLFERLAGGGRLHANDLSVEFMQALIADLADRGARIQVWYDAGADRARQAEYARQYAQHARWLDHTPDDIAAMSAELAAKIRAMVQAAGGAYAVIA